MPAGGTNAAAEERASARPADSSVINYQFGRTFEMGHDGRLWPMASFVAVRQSSRDWGKLNCLRPVRVWA
jgi:hypothetical protein